jgi:putative transposase
VKPAQKRDVVAYFRVGFKVSERRACEAAGVPRSSCRYQSQAKDQAALRIRLRDLAGVRVRYGYRRLHILLQREGWHVNHKRVFRLYRQEGLSLRLKSRKKRVSLPRVPPPAAERPNQRWSMDFVADRLADGRRFRILTLVDNVSRVSPAMEVDFSLTGERVVVVLDRLKATGGLPETISVDNGPEFISRALDAWAHRHGVKLEFSRPGKPTDNPFIESFNGHFRAECLDLHWFADLAEARQIIEAFRVEYNRERPHSALGNRTPAEFLGAWEPLAKASD